MTNTHTYMKSDKSAEHSAEESFMGFVQKGTYMKSDKSREHSAEESFMGFAQKGTY